MLSALRAPHTGGILDSAAWSVICKAMDVPLGAARGKDVYLLCFVHLSISLAFVLEDWIPAFEAVRLKLANFRKRRLGNHHHREEQHTEIGRPSRRHNLAGCTSLEEDGVLAGTRAERERADRRGRLVFVRCEEIVQACVAKGV
jgi:hypothetical protein